MSGPEEYARLRETLDVMADPALLAEVKAGRSYFRRGGRGIAVDEVLPKPVGRKPMRRRS